MAKMSKRIYLTGAKKREIKKAEEANKQKKGYVK